MVQKRYERLHQSRRQDDLPKGSACFFFEGTSRNVCGGIKGVKKGRFCLINDPLKGCRYSITGIGKQTSRREYKQMRREKGWIENLHDGREQGRREVMWAYDKDESKRGREWTQQLGDDGRKK